MVKFSKQFECQIVPEWKEAFVDYKQLKKDLKKFHVLNTNNTNAKQHTLISSLRTSLFGHQHREHGVIQVLSLSLALHQYVHVIMYQIRNLVLYFF